MTLSQLRRKHPRLIYQDFEVKPDGKNLLISFNFLLEPDIRFRPEISIPISYSLRSNLAAARLPAWQARLDLLVFNLGMVEAISYWKAACPAELVIEAGYLSPDQIAWWKYLFIHGLGEFFFRNKIDFTVPNFLTIRSDQQRSNLCRQQRLDLYRGGDLILVGGGKDSIVTLETLKQLHGRRIAMMVNPGPNSLSATKLAGYQNPIIITRKIDPQLLQLNKLGYLNGHTPFSAYLAFLGILVADLYGYKNVISSNELGAGEASLIYKSMEINHQYSKSLAFEKNFRDYCRKYLFTHAPESHWYKPVDEWLSVRGSAPANLVRREATAVKPWSFTKQSPPGDARRRLNNINYFSFLRPLYELQIAKLFANLPISPKYDSAFVSCNIGRGKFWCGLCPKCAFSYLSLFPFMSSERMKDIFKSDLFDNTEIQKHILDLVGLGQYKPFDCVGTKDESILAVALSIKKLRSEGKSVLDFLLFLEKKLHLIDQGISQESPVGARKLLIDIKKTEKRIMENWGGQNFLPPEYFKVLNRSLLATPGDS